MQDQPLQSDTGGASKILETIPVIDPQDQQADPTDIKSIIWDFVKPNLPNFLVFPESIEYPPLSELQFFQISNGNFEIFGTLKAKYSLGNIVTQTFCASVNIDLKGVPTTINNCQIISNSVFSERIKLAEQQQNRFQNGITYLSAQALANELSKQPLVWVPALGLLPVAPPGPGPLVSQAAACSRPAWVFPSAGLVLASAFARLSGQTARKIGSRGKALPLRPSFRQPPERLCS
jgi:hypothetical protein